MKNKRRGILFVVSGPSGVGKGTILERVIESDDKLIFSISATTRPPRPGEQDGIQYFFMNREKFEDLLRNEGFIEHAMVHENYYGTPASFVDEKLTDGKDVVLDIDVQGALQVMKSRPDSVFVFIAPPGLDIEILKSRLKKRNTETHEQIIKRISVALEELKHANRYEYLIFNDDLETAINDLNAVVRAERCRTKRIKPELMEENNMKTVV